MADRHRDDEPLIPASGPAPDALSADTPAPGLVLRQPRRGYRWGVEVYLLADFALRGGPAAHVVELGAGSGVVSALLATVGVSMTAVERSPRWLPVLRENLAPLGVGVVHADVRTWEGGPFDLAVCNPPWFDPASGPASPDPWKAESRTAHHGGPEAFARAGLRLAPRVCVVGPRGVEVEGAHVARSARSHRLVLTELRRGPGPTVVEEIDLPAAYRRFRGDG